MKTSKKALFGSVLSLLLCCSMLVGTTFAWFTDEVSSGINTIQSGTLDIGLYEMPATKVFNMSELSTYTDLENGKLSFRDKNGKTDILWEPGATFMAPDFTVVNKGNLNAKAKIAITGIDADEKLLEVIDFDIEVCVYGYGSGAEIWGSLTDYAPDGEIKLAANQPYTALRIVAKMDEAAGNEYQGLTLDGIGITVLATQDANEADSFNNQYDKDATHPAPSVSISSDDELADAMYGSGTLKLVNDIVVDDYTKWIVGRENQNIVLDMNGKTMALGNSRLDPMVSTDANSVLTITGNGTFDLGSFKSATAVFSVRGEIIIENGTFVRNRDDGNTGMLIYSGQPWEKDGSGKIIIKGGYFDSGCSTADCARKTLVRGTNGELKVYGGTFVGMNPAWGYNGYYFLEGQTSAEVPAAYTIIEGTTSDGRPTYTVIYNP